MPDPNPSSSSRDSSGRLPDGDFESLCERFYPLVEQRVRRLLACDVRRGRPWLAAKLSTGDVVQDVFLSVLRDQGSVPEGSDRSIAAYFGRLVRNRLIDSVRHLEAGRRDSRRARGLATNTPAAQRSPSSDAQAAEQMASFNRALAAFDERQRAILQARLEDKVPFLRIAKTFGYKSAESARKSFNLLQARLVARMTKGATSE